MTDTPTTTEATFGEYDGRPVDEIALELRGLGGGLDDPLAVDGERMEIGTEFMVCVPAVVVEHRPKVKNRKEPDEGALTLVHVAIGNGPIFPVDADSPYIEQARGEHQTKVLLAQKAVEDAKALAKAQAEQAKRDGAGPGQGALAVDTEALTQQHLAGDHADPEVFEQVKGDCPECVWEVDCVEREELGLEPGPRPSELAEAVDAEAVDE
jgi:hypothetical protein